MGSERTRCEGPEDQDQEHEKMKMSLQIVLRIPVAKRLLRAEDFLRSHRNHWGAL
jgi:hypothetical protein